MEHRERERQGHTLTAFIPEWPSGEGMLAQRCVPMAGYVCWVSAPFGDDGGYDSPSKIFWFTL